MPLSAVHSGSFEPLSLNRVDGDGAARKTPDRMATLGRAFTGGHDRAAAARAIAEARRAAALADPERHIASLNEEIARLRADHASALAQARRDGFEAGLNQALAEQNTALLAAVDAVHAAVETLEEKERARQEAITSEAALLAFEIADKLAGIELQRHPLAAIEKLLSQLLQEAGWHQGMTISVHPTLSPQLRTRLMEAGAGRQLAVEIVADAALAMGDARIEWPGGGILVDRNSRREAVASAMAGVIGKPVDVNELAGSEEGPASADGHSAGGKTTTRTPGAKSTRRLKLA